MTKACQRQPDKEKGKLRNHGNLSEQWDHLYVGIIDIATLEMLEGDLPAKALMLTKEWGRLYQKELLTIWETQEFIALPPLE